MKYWLMRAGNDGEARDLFLNDGVIAMDWKVGDLGLFPADRKSFVKAYLKWSQIAPQEGNDPQKDHSGSLAREAGTNYRFIHLAQIGDYVLFTPKSDKDRYLYLGQIESAYYYNPAPDPELPDFKHQRKVKWLARCPRADLLKAIVHPRGTMSEIDQIHHQEIVAKFTSML
jgi:restriction system protein